jgi:hypothetical protein
VSAWNGARIGWSGGYSARTLTPLPNTGYGNYAARAARYALARAYLNNEQYGSLYAYSAVLRTDERLYKFIRSIMNPVLRENNLHVAYTYAGSVNTESLNKGALPLEFDNKAMEPALRQGLKWSNLDQQLGKYVGDAALLGDVAWWVVDDPYRRRTRLELLEPDKIKYVERDEVGNVRAAVIEYEYDEQPEVARYQPSRSGMTLRSTKTYTRTMIVDKDSFRTYRDGEPYAYYTDSDGNPVSEWENIYGFVPLKLGYYAEGADGWGRNSFFGTPRRQIDELNDQASIINDSVRQVVVPLLAASGIASAEQISIIREDKDSMAVLYLHNAEATITPISVPIDIGGAAANRDKLQSELEANMPILALTRVRDFASTLSGKAIEQLFGDATSVVKQTRKNLDPPLAAALQMMVTIGGIQGYDGFDGFNADSYDRGDMELRIAERPVIDDTPSRQEKMLFLPQVSQQPPAIQRLMLEEAGYSDTVIEEVLAEAKVEAERKAQVAEQIAAGMGAQQDGTDANAAGQDEQVQEETANV